MIQLIFNWVHYVIINPHKRIVLSVKFVLVRKPRILLLSSPTILLENFLGVYVKIETALGDGQSTYVSLDVYYAPTNIWVGQILFSGSQLVTPPNVIVREETN